MKTRSGRPTGRPSLTGSAGPSPQITIPLVPEMKKALEELARFERRSRGDLAREALAEYLERRGIPPIWESDHGKTGAR